MMQDIEVMVKQINMNTPSSYRSLVGLMQKYKRKSLPVQDVYNGVVDIMKVRAVWVFLVSQSSS